eukprot:CAMPEP_0177784736 /NCGR_PEP_ID=MMETSP0491_2-20121128/19892_1 /TAXON_ID=63592 /ORGANISM="Tetraselmis chuii, Strain PLY429" /LENGTH=62 /DNA_ID=CAMNT_0019305587 /DNA_START=110 /DNA_END=294 /DNA_ORIENTATION=+
MSFSSSGTALAVSALEARVWVGDLRSFEYAKEPDAARPAGRRFLAAGAGFCSASPAAVVSSP